MNYSFKITFNIVIKLSVFVKINFKWVLDDGKANLNVKTGEIGMHNQISSMNEGNSIAPLNFEVC